MDCCRLVSPSAVGLGEKWNGRIVFGDVMPSAFSLGEYGRLRWQHCTSLPVFLSICHERLDFSFLVNFNGIVTFYLYIAPVWIKVFMKILCRDLSLD